MARTYQQLGISEREAIQMGMWEGKSLRMIAFELGRAPSTLSRELARNYPEERRRYAPRLAQERARECIRSRGVRPRLKYVFTRDYVHRKLAAGYSPEQIAGRLAVDHDCHISPEAIYQYIYTQYAR